MVLVAVLLLLPYLTSSTANPVCGPRVNNQEQFTMRLNLCRKNSSLFCEVGGGMKSCTTSKEAFRSIAVMNKQVAECLLEANTTTNKHIRFVIQTKLIKNLNELGSRGFDPDSLQRQRGKCTLGYTCDEDNDGNYFGVIRDIQIDCFAYLFNSEEQLLNNGTEFHFKWVAPHSRLQDSEGTEVDFGALISIKDDMFFLDVSSARAYIPW